VTLPNEVNTQINPSYVIPRVCYLKSLPASEVSFVLAVTPSRLCLEILEC
jgi:hypothetical protein